jgi:hypothetical protein
MCRSSIHPIRICLPQYSAPKTAQTLEKYQIILQKLFLHTHVDKIQEFSDLSRMELLRRINGDSILHAAAGGTGATTAPVDILITSRETYLFSEEDSDTRSEEQKMSSNCTNIVNAVVLPPQHGHCLEPSTILTSGSRPQDTSDDPTPAPADQWPASRKDQAVQRIGNLLEYFLTRTDDHFETSF